MSKTKSLKQQIVVTLYEGEIWAASLTKEGIEKLEDNNPDIWNDWVIPPFSDLTKAELSKFLELVEEALENDAD